MIEIKCSKTEKEKIIRVLEVMDPPCLFPRTQNHCYLDYTKYNCKKCLETKIKWVIEK